MITIHNFARGARGVRVMWQCEEMGLPYRFEVVSYPPSEAYRALNPLGTVPFLEDDGVAINESIAMMLYLAEKYGPSPLLPDRQDPALARVLQWTVLAEATIGAGMNPLLAARFGAPEEEKQTWLVHAQDARVEQAVRHVADKLGDRPFLVGEGLTLADIAMSTALGIWRGALGHALPDTLAAYQDRMQARPAYQRAKAMQAPAPNRGT